MNTLGERLKQLRTGLSQHAAAERLGIPQTTWSNYERDKNKPDFGFLDKVCLEFRVSADWLLFGRGSMRPGGIDGQEQTDVAALEARVLELEAQNAALEAENRTLLLEMTEARKDALNAYKRLYAVFPAKRPKNDDGADMDAPSSAPSAPAPCRAKK